MIMALLLVAIGVVPLLWGCLVLLFLTLVLLVAYLVWLGRRAAKPTPAQHPDQVVSDHVDSYGMTPVLAAELPSTFSGALDVLRSRTPGPDFRYTVPWFLLLGPTDSGKSSLISDSALSYVVEEQVMLEHSAGFTWNIFGDGVVI